MIITVESYVSPIQSLASHNHEVILKKETVEVVSSINSIVAMAEVSKRQLLEVTSFMTFINSFVSVLNDSKGRIETRIVMSYVSPIQAHTDVLIPLNNNVVNAYTSVIYNPSMATYSENISQLDVINNPSFVEVME
ncbi:hypothetical protein [Heyndrickxia sporothermodurans]|uniref:Uncharacterized protein n=1 Tax=Heyndrickxia sporothermodurans TaxID=46224 RepID=A0AB37HK15_9BACI|nr:hypothetical protein [Heyndrickxia sporothermodurans]MBL5769285.1 hypothetical protein [Heyndrickxia sporothermodurans]MBL5773063.1 hypothetical protein [Heyndrickxia sporothermodurans]MBL5776556.1 hypothetical protein [Heyndrickxia sporothermodurans]MBL5783660.1 hypothetical protein [Heyndrickxia sporothermodurans]MBL5787159.1 hypothetical protein [Heyndrickxia sporothermodurans]